MPLIYAVAGFLAGYVFALSRRNWQDWVRSSATTRRLRSRRWSDMRSTVLMGAILFGLLYIYIVGKA